MVARLPATNRAANQERALHKFGAVLAAGIAVAGLTSAGPALATVSHPARAETVTAIHWGHCSLRLYPDLTDSGAKCAALKVPMDYSDPTGTQITLEVSLLRHTSSTKHYKGVILSNPGGPGASALDLSLALEPSVPHNVGADYDWVSWDPRGVGASKPALHCQRGYFSPARPSYVPTTKHLVHYWLKRSKSYAHACERKYPQLLNNMTTIDSAMDMDSIRQAIGVSKISYYGYSYGTYLGEVYSTLYPSRVKRMVLDSNVNPRRVWYRANLNQDRAFNRNIGVYFRWVAKYDRIYHLGSTEKAVAARYYRNLATLTKRPDGRLGPAAWTDAFESAGYNTFDWTDLASAWRAYARHGHAGAMVQEFVGSDITGDDNEFAVYNAVQCTDTHWPTRWSRWKKDNDAYYKKYPFLTWANAWFNSPCLYWGGKAHTPVKVNGTATKSVLLIDQTLDAATPYSGSLEVRKLYPNARLIAEPGGTTHADSLDGDACVDNRIAAYLKTGRQPVRRKGNGPDAVCRPLSNPTPNSGPFSANRTRPGRRD